MPVGAIVGGIGGLATTISGISRASAAGKEAQRIQNEINNYQRQDLVNPYEGLQVSTLGADRQREDLARTMATYGNLAAMGGGRNIAAMLPQLLAQQNAQEAQIMAGLDEQEKQRQQLIAQGNGMVQQMTEQRERDDLLGLGNALNVANQNKSAGWNTFAQGMGGLAMMGASGLFNKQGIGTTTENVTTTPTTVIEERQDVQIPNTNPIVASSLAGMPGMFGMSSFLPYAGYKNPSINDSYLDFLKAKQQQTA